MIMRMSKVLAPLLAACLIATQVLAAGPPWSLFGTAAPVRSGQGPNPWAIRLTSQGTATYGGVAFQNPSGPLKFDDIYYFGTDFRVQSGNCGGGSPRFQLNIDKDGDGTVDGNVFVYIGMFPSFTLCDTIPPGNWQTTGNLVDATDLRYDTSQIGGTFYDSYSGTKARLDTMFPNHKIPGIQLVVDAGWSQLSGNQIIDVDKVIVNEHIAIGRGFAKQ
jgi:hypothetical protein